MSNFKTDSFGWILPEEKEEKKKNGTVEVGKASSKHMIMMLNLFHDGLEHSQEHRELWSEMCDNGNNILDNIVIREDNGTEIISIVQGKKSIDVISGEKGFNKSLVKDKKSGNIGLLVTTGGHEIMGSRCIDVMECMPFPNIITFIYKIGNKVYMIDLQNTGARYYLTNEEKSNELNISSKEERKEEELILSKDEITEDDIVALSKEINSIDDKYMKKIALDLGDNPEELADKLFEDGYITKRSKAVIKAVQMVMDIIQ